MTELIVNLSGVGIIAFIIIWFWMMKPKTQTSSDQDIIEVIVNNGVYTPSVINMTIGKTVTLRFIRKDPSQCAAAVIFNDFDISAELEVDVPVDVRITPSYPGEFAFTCEMAMYQGVLVVSKGCH